MKKTLKTLVLAIFVVLTTATFGFAEYTANRCERIPIFSAWMSDCRRDDDHLSEAKIFEDLYR